MYVCTWEVYDDLQGDYALHLLSFTVFAICGTHYTMLLYSNRTWPQEQTQRNISEQVKQLRPPSGTLQCQASVFSWCQFKKDGRARVLLHPARDLKSTFTKEQTAENHFLKKIFRLLLCKSMNQTWGRARFITLKTTMRRNPRTHLEA